MLFVSFRRIDFDRKEAAQMMSIYSTLFTQTTNCAKEQKAAVIGTEERVAQGRILG